MTALFQLVSAVIVGNTILVMALFIFTVIFILMNFSYYGPLKHNVPETLMRVVTEVDPKALPSSIRK